MSAASAVSRPGSAAAAAIPAAVLARLTTARRVVIKVGTNVLVRHDGRVALGALYGLVESIAALQHAGREIVLVSSGAVGIGALRLGAGQEASAADVKQACAAVGQSRLMALYEHGFAQLGAATAQVLVADADVATPPRRGQLRTTIATLLRAGIVPVLNENDAVSAADATVSIAGGPRIFSDNDMLAALIATTIEADALLLLSDVDGLYTANPARASDATLIPLVHAITADILAAADAHTVRGRGGMAGKLAAAQIAAAAGVLTILANGRRINVADLLAGTAVPGTIVLPHGFDLETSS